MGSGGGKGEGVRSVQREKGEAGGEGLNASHVKLMRTNLQKLESCFPSPALYCSAFVSFLALHAINLNLPMQELRHGADGKNKMHLCALRNRRPAMSLPSAN